MLYQSQKQSLGVVHIELIQDILSTLQIIMRPSVNISVLINFS